MHMHVSGQEKSTNPIQSEYQLKYTFNTISVNPSPCQKVQGSQVTGSLSETFVYGCMKVCLNVTIKKRYIYSVIKDRNENFGRGWGEGMDRPSLSFVKITYNVFLFV